MYNFIPYYSILLIAVISLVAGLYQNKYKNDDQYFIGNRNTHWILAAVSICATFLYANVPFFIIKWQPVYGFAGGIWVTLGIVIPLMLLGIIGYKIAQKKNYKKFFNLTDLILEKSKSKKLLYTFIFVYVLAAIYNLSANLTALGFVTEYFTSVNYALMTGIFLAAVTLYTVIGGFTAVVRTDFIQMAFILLGGLVTGLVVTADISSPSQIISEQFGNFFDPNIVFNIGLTIMIIIFGSAITDNGLFQRIFSIGSSKNVLKAFGLSAVLYFIACFGVMMIYGGWQASGIDSGKPIFSVLDTIKTHSNTMMLFFFITAMISMSASNLDSVTHSISSLLSRYFVSTYYQKRVANVILLVFVVVIYTITQFKIDLWLLLTTFGTVRLTVVFPTLYIIFFRNINVLAILTSIIVAMILGLYLQSIGFNKLYTVAITLFMPLKILLLFAILNKFKYTNKELKK